MMRKPTPNFGLDLFSLLPCELFCDCITPYLSGCCLEILNASAKEEQKKQVSDVQSVYHLIMINGQYQLGFCDANNQYQTTPLDDKAPLERYIANHVNDLLPGISQDVELLELVEREIKAAGGKINPARKDLGNASDAIHRGIQQRREVIKQEIKTNAEKKTYLPNNFFQENEKFQAFDALLVHVARGEYDEVETILQKYPELLVWKCNGDMKRPDHSSRTFKNVSAFQLALWAGDWCMWKMMLRVVAEDQKTYYCDELLKQYDDLMKNGLQYMLDNLTLCGLLIIQGAPTQQQQEHAECFNAYHLIIGVDGSYFLGFHNQATKTYVQKPLSDNSQLKQRVQPNPKETNELTRDSVILKFAKEEFLKVGALIHVKCCESRFDLQPLLGAIEVYADNMRDWDAQGRRDLLEHQWSRIVGLLQRYLPPHVLHEYLGIARSLKSQLVTSKSSFIERGNRPLPPVAPRFSFIEIEKSRRPEPPKPPIDKDLINKYRGYLLSRPLLDGLGSSFGLFRSSPDQKQVAKPWSYGSVRMELANLTRLAIAIAGSLERLREQLVHCNIDLSPRCSVM